MTDISMRLSAYLDGELTPAEAEILEARLDNDPDLQAELTAMMEAEAAALAQFEDELNTPLPFDLVQKINDADLETHPPKPANLPFRPLWGAIAAAMMMFAIGGAGGIWLGQANTTGQTANWLTDVADYHAVYAQQDRHLVEVSASEKDHLLSWLGNTVGTQFTIPDLSAFALTFEGGRLLVANGKPVAQLMYRQADGTVIALCLTKSNPDALMSPGSFDQQNLSGFDMVSWQKSGTNYVVVGPKGFEPLSNIARVASTEI